MQTPLSGNFFKKLAIVFLFAELLALPMQANPGDTTVVTVWNLRKLTQYGNYDTTAVFPTGKRYRKIRLHYILGRYACPAGSQYCGSWDYTTQIFAMPANKDTVEVSRIITPYATDWLSQNKTHEYIEEVTDYATLLDGSCGMRFHYSGYSWGFTITLKIEFIEGVPPMDALSIDNIYNGYYTYGNVSNSIENYLTEKPFTYQNAGKVYLKNTVSGHGSDNTGCAEFCNKAFALKVNNSTIAQRQIWRNNCGINDVYPQTGTWVYDRGGWCPGAIVWPSYFDLSTVTSPATQFSVNIDMQSYVGSGSLGGYNFETQMITYSAPNATTDVSIEDIMAPTKDANYVRHNPRCSNPIIRLKNTGTATVTSVEFAYQVNNATPITYTWTGSLNFLDTVSVVFPPSTSLFTGSTTSAFHVSVTAVNGQSGDDNLFNNMYHSKFDPVLVVPDQFVLKFLTNNNAAENNWVLFDENDVALVSSQAMNNTTLYKDTIYLIPGCYKLVLNDYGCDGLNWWANPGQGSGSLRIERMNGTSAFVFPVDFGCNYTKYFAVAAPTQTVDTTSVAEYNNLYSTFEVFPSPASDKAMLKIETGFTQTIRYRVQDINGRTLFYKQLGSVSTMYETIDVSTYQPGLYFVALELENGQTITKKLVVE